LVYLDPAGCQRSFSLSDRGVVTLGRRPEADVCLPWDLSISRLHAELIHRSGEWLIADDGLSQNGTLVNGMPVEGRRRLRDGDLITLGRTSLTFCAPSTEADGSERHRRRRRARGRRPGRRGLGCERSRRLDAGLHSLTVLTQEVTQLAQDQLLLLGVGQHRPHLRQ
jgi:pSer/pThr/pTyr-binding forkhead associated (FHA) protein